MHKIAIVAFILIFGSAEGARTTHYVDDALGHVTRATVGSGPDGDGDPRVTETVYNHPLYLPTLTRRALDGATWASASADYDGNGNPTFNRDAEGRETTRLFDDRDRLITQTEPLGRITTFSYDNADRKISETLANPSGSGDQTRRWEYDAAGRNTSIVDASGGRRVSSFDAHGNVLSRRDARGNPTEFTYDARHQVLTRSGPESNQLVSYTYDRNGNAVGETWANGRAITRSYDLLDRLTDSRDADGFFEKLTWTPEGQIQTRRDGNNHLTTNHYDDLHRLERQELPPIAGLPRQTAQTFTVHDDIATATDANGNTTTHAYDALGRRIRTTRPEVEGASATTHTGYDLVGNVIRSTDARGNITHFTVDALNRRTGQTDPADGEGVVYTQSWSYDQAGNAISHSDRRGIVSESRFDKENRILGTSRAGLTLSTLTRDADGNVRTAQDALGRLTTTTFDKASRKVLEERTGASERWSWTPENDLATHTDADGRVSQSTYDLRRQLIAETNPAGETTEHTYDGAGHRLTTQRPLGDADHRWVSTYDEGDRLASVTDPNGHTTTYRYDAHGNRTEIVDANSHTTTFTYDARHRLIRKTWPTVGSETALAHWTFDADDNEATHTTPKGALIASTHDALNRRTDQIIDTVAAGEVRSTHWVFDGNANLTAIRETVQGAGERRETRRYDAFDRLEAVTDHHGKTLGYGYDLVGNRTSLTDADGQTTDYSYDALNHNRTVTLPGQGETTQTWLPSGRLASITRPDGSTTTHTYDAAGRVETITHANPGGVIANLRYRYDLNGNRIEQKETNGAVTETIEQTTGYEYDRADRLVTVHEPARTLTYTLDAVGNRTTETVTDESAILVSQSTLSYDERDRLTERSDPVQALVISQSWDADGNRTGQTVNGETRTFTYDARDRLVTLQQPGAPPLSFDYDSHGLRTKKTQGGAEARYQYDQSRLIAETNAIGNTLSRLHYGATQLLARTEAGSTPSHRNYLLDALNSPIVLTNNDGSISARTKYDAFGEILAQQGTAGQLTTPNPNAATAALLTTDQQPIGFTGYQKDEESGLYYAKARYYDPTVARFTTEDPEAGKAERPPSLHRYLYAYANPTIYIDPDGRQSCPVALSASECHALTAERLGVDPYSREGARAVAEFEAGLTIGQLRGAWTAVKETAQFVADVPGSAIDLIPGVDVGSLDRMGERASNAWEFVKAPVQTVKIAAQAQGTAYAESLEAGDYRGAGEVQGNLEGGIVASAAMSYTGAGLSNLARSSRLLGMADQQSKALVVVESASTMRAAVNPLQVTESVAAVRANPWNEFQKATRGQFVSRADAAQAYKTLYNEQSPWPQGYDGGNLVLLPGARVNMAMAPTQSSNRPGGWVTFDPIPDVDYVRRRLAVSAEFKPEIDRVVSYEVTQPMPGRHGPVGPQIDRKTGAYLEGMGTQIELGVSRDDRMKYLKLVDEEGLQ